MQKAIFFLLDLWYAARRRGFGVGVITTIRTTIRAVVRLSVHLNCAWALHTRRARKRYFLRTADVHEFDQELGTVRHDHARRRCACRMHERGRALLRHYPGVRAHGGGRSAASRTASRTASSATLSDIGYACCIAGDWRCKKIVWDGFYGSAGRKRYKSDAYRRCNNGFSGSVRYRRYRSDADGRCHRGVRSSECERCESAGNGG